jgi:hypothetical protein
VSDAKPDSKDQSGASPGAARPRIIWWQVASISLFAALLGGALYYGSAMARASAFQDERAFRVLGEVATQIRNLQTSRATLLTSMDPFVVNQMPLCGGGGPGRSANPREKTGFLAGLASRIRERTELLLYRNFIARLDLFDARFCKSNVPADREPPQAEAPKSILSSTTRHCDELVAENVALSVNLQNHQLASSISCRNETRIELRESLDRAVATFVSQDFFNEALLVLPSGEVLEEFPLHDSGSNDSRVRLHATIADRFNILNAKGLLEAPRPSGEDEAQKEPKAAVGLGPVAFDHEIAGQSHRVFVLPFRAPYPLSLAAAPATTSSSAAAGPDSHLFIVGVKRIALADEIVHSLWPLGLWIITLVICTSLLAWPLLSLAFGPAEESFSIRKAVACAFGLLAVPAVLAIAAASLWSMFELQGLMRARASTYARELATHLHDNVRDAAEILTSYRSLYSGYLEEESSAICADGKLGVFEEVLRSSLPVDERLQASIPHCAFPALASKGGKQPLIGVRSPDEKVPACLMESELPRVCDTVRIQQHFAPPGSRHWSPLRTVLAVNANGDRFGPVLTLFGAVRVSKSLNLSNREYFQALKHNQYWVMSASDGTALQLVSQRLYNRSDASKALQIVVPLCDPTVNSEYGNFCGLVTGDLRMHGLIAPVAPPLLKFAVIDTSIGTVLFHSSDSRGLAENFFRESEQNPALFAAIKSRRDAKFGGRYLGDPYSFFYVPVPDTPWGVVVFYSKKDLGDLPFRAGAAALSAYAGWVIVALLVAFSLRWAVSLFRLRTPTVADCVQRCWPTVPLPKGYRHLTRFRPSLVALLAVFGTLLAGASWWVAVIVILLTLVLATLAGWKFRRSGPSTRTPARRYVEFLAMVLTAVAIVPALAYFLSFHRLQLNALAHDGLVHAGYQVQRRYELIRQDLRRWVPPNGQEWQGEAKRFPEPQDLTRQPGLGLSVAALPVPGELAIDWKSSSEAVPAVERRTPTLVERLIWQATVGSPEQQRRIALMDGGDGPIRCGRIRESAADSCLMAMSDGNRIAVTAPSAPARNLLRQDEEFAWPRIIGVLAAVIGLAVGTWGLARLFTLRLLGLDAAYMSKPVAELPENCPHDAQRFQEIWKEQLTQPERLVLYQLASDHLVNPRNEAPIERLLALGLIQLRPWPRLAWPEMKDWILHSQSTAEFKAWQSDAGKGTWKTIRVPLFILLMALIAWLSWAAGGSAKALSAVLLATIALLGQLAQLFNFIRTGGIQGGKTGS